MNQALGTLLFGGLVALAIPALGQTPKCPDARPCHLDAPTDTGDLQPGQHVDVHGRAYVVRKDGSTYEGVIPTPKRGRTVKVTPTPTVSSYAPEIAAARSRLATDKAARESSPSVPWLGLFLLVLLAVFYFIPTLVAASNKHRNTNAIAVLNIFLGWTLVGWVIALVWAVKKDPVSVSRG